MALGRKTGGRIKGVSKNKATKAREQMLAASGLTPLEFMLGVMRNEANPVEVRLSAGKAAAPYVHPSLSSVSTTVSGKLQFEKVERVVVDGNPKT